MTPVLDPAMTVREVATFLNVDEKTIYRLAQKDELPGFKVAGAWRFQRADIQGWIDARKGSTSPGKAAKGRTAGGGT